RPNMSALRTNEFDDAVVRLAHGGADAWVGGRIVAREVREAELAAVLAPGATRPLGAGERAAPAEPDPYRPCFERDLDRAKTPCGPGSSSPPTSRSRCATSSAPGAPSRSARSSSRCSTPSTAPGTSA